jgi:hypothetical protein
MGRGTEGLQKMRQKMKAENEGIRIPEQVRCLLNPLTIRERQQRREIKASLVGFIAKGKIIAQRVVEKGVTAAGVTYKVNYILTWAPRAFTNTPADSTTSRASIATINQSEATVLDCTDLASINAML